MKFSLILFALSLSHSLSAQISSDSLIIEKFVYNDKEQLQLYCVRPSGFNSEIKYPAIVIFHGGGWSMGDASWGFSNARYYAEKGLVAFSVQYRLQDLDKGITPYESVLDAQDAMRWIRENSGQFSVDTEKIAAYGWSAGAHLAACASVFDNLDAPKDAVSSAPNLLLLKSPALSLMVYPNFQKRLLDRIDVRGISPAESVSTDTPPTLIVMGRDDTVTPLRGSELFRANMDRLGNDCELIVYDGVGHLFTPSSEPDDGWPKPDREVSILAQKEMDGFLDKYGYFTKEDSNNLRKN